MEQFDIAIVGAGPAGTSCALSLQNEGFRIAIIDKQKFPRDKVCGDAIPGPAFKAMKAINPEWEAEMKKFTAGNQVHSSAVIFPESKEIIKNWKIFSYNSKRVEFDNFLFDLVKKHTNTSLFEDEKIIDVSEKDQKIELSFESGSSISASLLIACDGANSIVSRKLAGHDYHDDPHIVAVRAYFRGIEGIEQGKNEFHFIKDILPAYFWIFPLGEGLANVGFGRLNNLNGKGSEKQNLKAMLHQIIRTDPKLAPRFRKAKMSGNIKGYSLPINSRKRKMSGHRFMLCGDAASLIDPITGSGIDTAMWSGHFAARQAIKCIASNNFSAEFISQYDAEITDKITSRLIKNYFVLRAFNRYPFLFRVLFVMVKNNILRRLINKYI